MLAAAGLLLRGRAGVFPDVEDLVSVMIRGYHDAAGGDLWLHQMAARRAYLGGMRFRLGALKRPAVIVEVDPGDDVALDDYPHDGVCMLRYVTEPLFLSSIMTADPRALSYFEFDSFEKTDDQ